MSEPRPMRWTPTTGCRVCRSQQARPLGTKKGAVAGPRSKTGVAPGGGSAKIRGADIGLGLRDGDWTEPTPRADLRRHTLPSGRVRYALDTPAEIRQPEARVTDAKDREVQWLVVAKRRLALAKGWSRPKAVGRAVGDE